MNEMIEEMAKDIVHCCNRYDKEDRFVGNKCRDCEYWCDTNNLCCSFGNKEATYLYELGYRKIPEGTVVLQQKDLTKLQNAITQSCNSKFDVDVVNYLTNTVESLESKLKELEEQRDRQAYIAEELIQEKHRWTEQARKETAEKILKDIMFCIDINDCNKNEMLIFNLCKMLAKQFGVEVEE